MSYTNRVPLDKNEDLLNYTVLTGEERDHIIDYNFHDRYYWKVPMTEWIGDSAHARCWELLTYHRVGVIAKRNLRAVLMALRQKNEGAKNRYKLWERYMKVEGERSNFHLYYELITTTYVLTILDPVRTKCVSNAINLASKKTPRREPVRQVTHQRAQQNGICKLPMDILWMICDYLSYETVLNTEKATGLRCGNIFWRSRISAKFFHEIRDIGDCDLDWGYLCNKLHEQYKTSPALNARAHILNCLDEVARLLERKRLH